VVQLRVVDAVCISHCRLLVAIRTVPRKARPQMHGVDAGRPFCTADCSAIVRVRASVGFASGIDGARLHLPVAITMRTRCAGPHR